MREPMAKGKDHPVTLKRHCGDVLDCVTVMLQALEPYLPLTEPSLMKIIRQAAIYHDLGKAASGMQRALAGLGRWDYRHEILSVAVIHATGFMKDSSLALASILTHHKSLNDPILIDCLDVNVSPDDDIKLLGNWRRRVEELQEYWDWIREFIRRSDASDGEEMAARLPSSPDELSDLRHVYCKIEQELKDNDIAGLSKKSIPYIVSRGLLMAADHLASSGIGEPQIEIKRPKMRRRKFQQCIASHQGSAILEAPTGSGKTRAAIAWALANRKAGERIYYVLPYQASINAMEKTLVSDKSFGFGENAVGIIHHNALLQEFRRYFDEETDEYDAAYEKAKLRLEQTQKFYRPIKIITPYQILKLLFGCKRFELGLSEMLGGIVIFDEIHAYEPHITALIEIALSRLRILGVRYLFMTATFPEFLKKRLFDCVPEMREFKIRGVDTWERNLLARARHRLRLHNCELKNLVPSILAAAKRGTVLVVCNRIEQAKQIFTTIRLEEPRTDLLHSGFTAGDRYDKERKLFKQEGSWRPACRILVATQVVEVSLNISFSTIFTEIAPVDDLLQRFGRVNRFYELRRPTEVHVATQYEEDKLKYVYDLERLRLTIEHSPDGMELTPGIESRWVQNVYASGYLHKEEEDYKRACESFKRVVDNLKPLYDGDDEEFYSLFKSYPVLPVELLSKYESACIKGRYLEATQLLMSLPASTFHRLDNEDAIVDQRIADKRETRVLVAKRHYDPDIGLTEDSAFLPPGGMEND